MKAIIVPKNNYNGVKVQQPIEIYVEDKAFEMLEQAQKQNKEKYINLISKLVKKHLDQYSYVMGSCQFHKKEVTYTECLNCGIQKCNGKRSKWEQCRIENITYAYPTKTQPKTIKDPKIKEKLKPTQEELEQEKKLYIIDK